MPPSSGCFSACNLFPTSERQFHSSTNDGGRWGLPLMYLSFCANVDRCFSARSLFLTPERWIHSSTNDGRDYLHESSHFWCQSRADVSPPISYFWHQEDDFIAAPLTVGFPTMHHVFGAKVEHHCSVGFPFDASYFGSVFRDRRKIIVSSFAQMSVICLEGNILKCEKFMILLWWSHCDAYFQTRASPDSREEFVSV